MERIVKRGIVVLLAILMIVMSIPLYAKQNLYAANIENNLGMLCIRTVVTKESDVGKAFQFTYTVNGGQPVDVFLAAGASSDKAYVYQMSMPRGTVVAVSEVSDLSGFNTMVNGTNGKSITVTISGSQTMVEFINSRPQ